MISFHRLSPPSPQGNYVPVDDAAVEAQVPEYDIILALSLTKWLHLNWGDEALKRTFRKMHRQLRPGGRLVLEPQAFSSYARKKRLHVSEGGSCVVAVSVSVSVLDPCG